eukprot:gene1441-biopygen6742
MAAGGHTLKGCPHCHKQKARRGLPINITPPARFRRSASWLPAHFRRSVLLLVSCYLRRALLSVTWDVRPLSAAGFERRRMGQPSSASPAFARHCGHRRLGSLTVRVDLCKTGSP